MSMRVAVSGRRKEISAPIKFRGRRIRQPFNTYITYNWYFPWRIWVNIKFKKKTRVVINSPVANPFLPIVDVNSDLGEQIREEKIIAVVSADNRLS